MKKLPLAEEPSPATTPGRPKMSMLTCWYSRMSVELPVKVLSQGQKRRVALARLLLQPPKLWILDEPFTALDVKAVTMLQEIIQAHIGQGGMVLLTTHQQVDIAVGQIQHVHLSTH